MKYLMLGLLASVVMLNPLSPVMAQVEPDFEPSKPQTTTPWFGYVNAAKKQADMNFIKGMHPHHAGALTMSQEYLANPDAKNAALQQLANGIIHNQKFEIGMLDNVETLLNKINVSGDAVVKAQIAEKGLAQKQRFMRAPMPRHRDASNVSAEDVRFAKAMIIHHEGALDMARDYLADPNADNGYLRLMCIDILKDQAIEIAFMQSVIDAYQGDADAIQIDPSMVHGMEGMNHGGGHGHHGHHAHH